MIIIPHQEQLEVSITVRGYDLHAMRKRETETERENRELREENSALRRALRAVA